MFPGCSSSKDCNAEHRRPAPAVSPASRAGFSVALHDDLTLLALRKGMPVTRLHSSLVTSLQHPSDTASAASCGFVEVHPLEHPFVLVARDCLADEAVHEPLLELRLDADAHALAVAALAARPT